MSGNLSFLNWLTILPSIFCFDDLFFKGIFPASTVDEIMNLQERDKNGESYPISKLAFMHTYIHAYTIFSMAATTLQKQSCCSDN